ncbi:hypothetical protein [Deinococcus koreensis]|uniref:Relaxase/mobilization nuclease domain-containing protein n=1 Tax=Deinococcus koreensis TaxID=2054903 RepID=A0A2K3US28_9DEIO|nr:hypothetical protein [Deinococcus koreensis]PNY79349.1 hypothetical protein CVO96_19685 [Deinococcus koreensis]
MGKVIDDVLGGRRGQQGGKVSLPSGGGRGRGPIRTVVKGRYRTLSGKGPNPARGRASAVLRNLDYMTTRPDVSDQRISRDVILPDRVLNVQGSLADRQVIEDELRAATEKYIYHLVLSSGDRSMSPRDVELWARAVLHAQGIDRFYLVVHAGDQGHTTHPHAHVIVRTDVRFGREEFFRMRQSGDVQQRLYRQLFRGFEESWKERVTENTPASGGGVHQTERDEEERRPKAMDIQFE